MFLWRYLLAPVLYPIISAPIMLPMSLLRPLQWALVLITWGCYLVHPLAAIGFIVVAGSYYVYTFIVPPSATKSPGLYDQWVVEKEAGGQLSRTVFTVGMMAIFLAGLLWLPDWSGILRWLAAAGLAYYLSTVAMGFDSAFEVPSFEEQVARLRERADTAGSALT